MWKIRLSECRTPERSPSSATQGIPATAISSWPELWRDPATEAIVSGLARFNPDGSPDSSFGGTGAILEPQSSIVSITGPILIQPGGKIVVAGQTDLGTHAPGDTVATIERFNENGSLDSTFAAPIVNGSLFGGLSSGIRGMALDSNGDIVAAGPDDSAAFGDVIAVARMTSNGVLDPSFGTGGVQTTNVSSQGELGRLTGVAIDSSGHIVVGGTLFSIAANKSAFSQQGMIPTASSTPRSTTAASPSQPTAKRQ